jgi:hypothetical protein
MWISFWGAGHQYGMKNDVLEAQLMGKVVEPKMMRQPWPPPLKMVRESLFQGLL